MSEQKQYTDADIPHFVEGDLVTYWYGQGVKEIFLVMKEGTISPDYYKALADPKAIFVNRYYSVEDGLKNLKNEGMVIRRIADRKMRIVNSRTDKTVNGGYYSYALPYVEEWLDKWYDYFNNIKQYHDEQKLFLLQGGHGDHRVRRNHVQTRKAKSAGTGTV